MKHTTAMLLFLSVALFSALATFLPGTSDFIVKASSNLYVYPGADIKFDYLTGVFVAMLGGIVLSFGPFNARLKPTLLVLWTFKMAFSLWVMLVFEYFYGLDSDGYFLPDWDPPSGFAFGMGTHNVRILCWAAMKIIGPSFHGGKVIFSFLSLIGVYLVYRGAVFYLKEESPRLLLIVGLSPTVLFWSSLLGKDPIALLVAGIYAHGCMGWIIEARKRYLLEALLAMLLASYVRSYFIPIMAIPMGIVFLIQSRRPLVRLLFLPVIVFAIIISVQQFTKRTKVDSFESFLLYEEKASAGWGAGVGARGNSSYSLPDLPSPLLLPLLIPFGIFSALFRPLPFEAHNPFAMAAAFDNSILLILSIYAYRRSKLRDFLDPKVIWALSYVCLFSAMYGIGTPNLGALSRFKIQAWPHFICISLYLARKRHIVTSERVGTALTA